MTPSPIPSLAAELTEARRKLGPDGALDAALLLAHVVGKDMTYLHTWPERVLTPDERGRYARLVERRAAGEPVAYLLGRREFWSLELKVTPATLIPRADTETLVAQALARIPAGAGWRIADLGTGSGAVALALAKERPACEVIATDASAAALEVARENGERLGLAVTFRQGDWYAALGDERFQLIVSNPPYIPEGDPHLDTGDLRREPRSALAAGADGLRDLRQLISAGPAHLLPGGWLLLEHGYDQGAAVRALMREDGYRRVETHRDLEGRERVTAGERP